MGENIIIAVVSAIASLVGTFGGIIASSKLTAYRIEQLEKKVDKHNTLIERTYKLEERVSILEKTGGK